MTMPNVNLPEMKHIEEAIGKALANTTGKLSENVGITLGDIWYLVFGGLSQRAQRRKLRYAHELEAFKTELECGLEAIPEEKRIDPAMQVVAPALEKARYCVEESILRGMFSRLIASACNADTADTVQPSFADIISTMTPLDAQNLLAFKKDVAIFPIAQYQLKRSGKGHAVLISDVFLSNPLVQSIERQAVSISSLHRLGLVQVDYTQNITDESHYSAFETEPTYLLYKARYSPENNPDYSGVEIKHGIVFLTSFGKSFVSVCLPQ